MLKSCTYCGGIHEVGYECPKKPKRKPEYNKYSEENAKITRFRSSQRWTNKSKEIRDRDNYLCQVCIRELYNTFNKYTYQDVEAHHINKLKDNWDDRLNNEELLSLCKMHHTMADLGEIPEKILEDIAKEQEAKALRE